MTLQNLLRIGRLNEHAPTAAEISRLLTAIDRNIADAAVGSISEATRFDAAYKAVMQCALVAMLAAGYRPATSEPGHHQTLLQSLPLTLGAGSAMPTTTPASRSPRRRCRSALRKPKGCGWCCNRI